MSRAEEAAEDRALAQWKADRALLRDLVVYVLARAARCHRCRAVALWRWTDRRPSGHPVDHLLCDTHKTPNAVELHGAAVLRRITR